MDEIKASGYKWYICEKDSDAKTHLVLGSEYGTIDVASNLDLLDLFKRIQDEYNRLNAQGSLFDLKI